MCQSLLGRVLTHGFGTSKKWRSSHPVTKQRGNPVRSHRTDSASCPALGGPPACIRHAFAETAFAARETLYGARPSTWSRAS